MTRAAALEAASAAPPEPAPASRPLRPGAPTAGPAVRVPAAYRFSWRALPRDIKFMAVGLVLVVVLGLAFLVAVPYRPKPIVPLLGWSEPTSPRKVETPPPRKSGRKDRKP